MCSFLTGHEIVELLSYINYKKYVVYCIDYASGILVWHGVQNKFACFSNLKEMLK